MKYKRGSIVEVLTKDEVPCHSWRCGQIVSGNGHNYIVRYDVYSNEVKEERVSRKFIRPCPPKVQISENYWPGDVVEVFHHLSWKMAIVSKSFGFDMFLVRLIGSSLEFEATKSELRVRQSWQNDEWAVIGKVHINSEEKQSNKFRIHNLQSDSNQRNTKEDFYMKSLHFGAQNDNVQESHFVSTRTLKRGSPYCLSQDEVNEQTPHKFKLTQKQGKRLRVLVTSPYKFDTSFENRAADVAREDSSGAASSIGSCSINNHKNDHMQGTFEGNDSDAESVCQGKNFEDINLGNEELAEEIHRLELQAYKRTIEALHASGPLSWEKETMAQSWRLVHRASESVT